jgi:hypothetical protein
VSSPEVVATPAARQGATGLAAQILNAFPLPNQPSAGALSGAFVGSFANPSSMDATSLRVDHRVNDQWTLFGRYNRAPSALQARALFSSANTISDTRALTETTTLGATTIIAPTVVNDLRINVSRSRAAVFYSVDDFAGTSAPPDSLFLPSFVQPGNAEGIIVVAGNSIYTGPNQQNEQRQFNLVDSLSFVKGSHALKFGVDYRRMTPVQGRPADFRQMVFADVASVLAGNVSTYILIHYGDIIQPIYSNFSAYGQDMWKATGRLTVTYGVRYDVNPAPGEQNGNVLRTIANVDPTNPAGAVLAPPGTPLYNTSRNNFAPRLGLSYKLRPQAETILHGGVGIFYDLGSSFTGSAFNPVSRTTLTNVSLSSPALTTPVAPLSTITLATPGARFVTYPPDYKLPYTLQYNVAIDQPVANGTLTAAYVGAVGRRLERLEQLRSINNIFFVTNTATSDYHALQLEYRRRLFHSVQALATYTLGRSYDIVSNANILNAQQPLEAYDVPRDRGPSDFDVRHSLTAAVGIVPAGPSSRGPMSAFAREWSIDAIVRARTATPINVTTGRDLLGVGLTNTSRPDLVPGAALYVDDPTVAGGRRINAAAFSTPAPGQQGTLGRNALRGFGASQVDLSLKRFFPIRGGRRLSAGFDVFNVFNQTNFTNPFGVLTNPSFGIATQSLNSGLAGQSALYQIGGPRSCQISARFSF